MTVKEARKFLNKPVLCKMPRGYHEYPKGIYILREIRQSVSLKKGEREWEHKVSVQNPNHERTNYTINVSYIYPPGEEGAKCSEQ